jgi:hypothetical protein
MGGWRGRCRSWLGLRRLMNGLWCRAGRTRRVSCPYWRRGWRRRMRCRYLRRWLAGFSRCSRSSWQRGARGDLRWMRRCMRPDPRGRQMREIRCTRRMVGRRRRRGHIGCGRRCRRRRRVSSAGGRLRPGRCRRRFLRGLRYGADARRRSELREIWLGGRTRRGRPCGFGLSGGRGCGLCRRHRTAGCGRHGTQGREWTCGS